MDILGRSTRTIGGRANVFPASPKFSPEPCDPGDPCALVQPCWEVDSRYGNDGNDGSPGHPLQHWSAPQKRLGNFTFPRPERRCLYARILTPLPEDDPYTFRNFFEAGFTGAVSGVRRVVY